MTEMEKNQLMEAARKQMAAAYGAPAAGYTKPADVAVDRVTDAEPLQNKGSGDAGKRDIQRLPVKTNPNRHENEFMLNLMVLRNSLRVHAPHCRERAKRAGKWVWRDIRIMSALLDKVQQALLATMPDRRDEYYASYARNGHYELRMNGPVRNPRQVLISDIRLADLCDIAMENECVLCMREGGEIGKCRLRAVLMEICPPTEIEDGRWRRCEYRDAAGRLLHGEEVTI